MKSKSCASGLMLGVEPDWVSQCWRRCLRLALHVPTRPYEPERVDLFMNRPVRTRMPGGVGRAG